MRESRKSPKYLIMSKDVLFMNFPQQIQQHKNESDSFAIILYKLRNLGIFRNVTAQDYGIDFEIELVEDGRVCGHCVKVQVKSSENLYKDKDERPSIGGIKQTTLRYWAELSYSIPVIVLCVDLKTETIYSTGAIFWQAVSLLDATDSTKSIKFKKEISIDELIDEIRKIAKGYSLREELLAHKWLLRNINDIFELYMGSWWYDAYCQTLDLTVFKSFLDNAKVIFAPFVSMYKKYEKNFNQLFSYDYYYRKSDFDGPYNRVVYDGLKLFFILFLKMLDFLRSQVIASGYYWAYNDDDYLKLVVGTKVPTFEDEEELKKFKYDEYFNKEKKTGWFDTFLEEIEKEAKCEKGELMQYLMGKHGYYSF